MEKFMKLLKNYYVVFAVCMLCVVVTVVMFGIKYYGEYKARETALEPPPYIAEITPVVSEAKEQVESESEEISEVKENTEIKKEEITTETMAIPFKNTEFLISMPVGGEILKEFSENELVYSKTFDDYRVHNGVDIKANRSEAVFSVYDGTVEDVYTDPLEGIVIVINHNNGFQSVYKNLSSDKMVKKGELITKGQVISGVGDSGIFESAEENHIHFELKKDGVYVNPIKYKEWYCVFKKIKKTIRTE